MLWGRKRYWPCIWLGAWAANLVASTGVLVSAAIATGNTLEAVIAALIIRWLLASESEWRFVLRTLAFICAAGVGGLISAGIGPFVLALSKDYSWDLWPSVMTTWWVGDFLGILVVTPLLLELDTARMRALRARALEKLALVLLLGGVCYGLFLTRDGLHQVFLVFPFLLWAAARFDRLTMRLLVVLISALAVGGTVNSVGQFHFGTLNQNLICLQLFLASVAVTSISLIDLVEAGMIGLPAVSLLISWAGAGLLFSLFLNTVDMRDREHFARLVEGAEISIQTRIAYYENALRAGQSLVQSMPRLRRRDWNHFIDSFHLVDRFPAMRGMGVMAAVPDAEVAAFERAQIADGSANYRLHFVEEGEPVHDMHYMVRFLQPDYWNQTVQGLDVRSEPRRRAAAELARDLGEAVATENILLARAQDRRLGLLILQPYYRDGAPTGTVEDRRAALQGFVYSPFIFDTLFANAIGPASREIEFAVFPKADSPMEDAVFINGDYDGGEAPVQHTSLLLAHRQFHFGWWRSEGFLSARDTTAAWVAAAGALVSLLIALVVSGLQSLSARAEQIAKRRTAELAASEAALRMATRRLQNLFQVSPWGILAIDLQGRVTIWNPACENIFGWKAEEVIGQWMPFMPEGQGEYARAQIERIKNGSGAIGFQALRRHKSGRDVHVRVALMPIFDDGGRLDGVMACIADFTQEKQAQDALEVQRASAVSGARMAALGEMAAGIAHEINNPLAIIAGQASLLRLEIERGQELSRDSLMSALSKIENVVFRISKIIRGLRTFSRTSEKEAMMAKDVQEIVNETLEFCQERFRNHGVELEVKLTPNLRVPCQGVQISQVLLNLLNNAFDAVAKVRAPWIHLEAREENGRVLIAVEDNGGGIPAEYSHRIMEPFFTTKPPGQGTGLGLSIAKGIVEQHGGKLYLVELDGRARFVVDLPES
jgi:PAS domain S-box-containing protein